MNYQFRKAASEDAPEIWKILQYAIQKRKEEGSNQWQDGYPNPEVIYNDIAKKQGFVLTAETRIIGYCAIAVNDEPAYNAINGNWQTHGDFIVFHRAAISKDFLGLGLSVRLFQYIENYALEKKIFSVKADTNFDNKPMLHLFKKLGYIYCGEVYFRNAPRKAFEKVLAR